MNRIRLISLAALLVLPFAPGCYVYHDHGGGSGVYTPANGDVTFFWSFEGASCYREPDIQYVHITIPGESLDSGGYYSCNNAGSDGITLHNFVGGTSTSRSRPSTSTATPRTTAAAPSRWTAACR